LQYHAFWRFRAFGESAHLTHGHGIAQTTRSAQTLLTTRSQRAFPSLTIFAGASTARELAHEQWEHTNTKSDAQLEEQSN
jgi:hypothetical protein